MKRSKFSDFLRPKFSAAVDEQAAPPVAEPTPEAKGKKKRPSPISVRLNEDELAALRKAAVGRSMSGYIRERLFGDACGVISAKPVAKDYEALARVLGALGQTDIYTNLASIALAIEQNKLRVDRQTEASITAACDAVSVMRAELLVALGLRGAR